MRAWLKHVAMVLWIVVVTATATGVGAAEKDEPTCGVEADLVSRFVFRGVALSRGPVVQPSVWGSIGGWTVTGWANVLLEDRQRHRLSAALASLEDEVSVGRLTIAPGVVVYDGWRGRREHVTAEASLDGAFDLGRGFHVVSTHAVDTASRPGAYFGTAGGEWRGEDRRASIRARAEVAWGSARFNAAQFGRPSGGVDVALGSIRARYALSSVFFAAVLADAAVVLLPAARPRGAPGTLVTFGTALGAEL